MLSNVLLLNRNPTNRIPLSSINTKKVLDFTFWGMIKKNKIMTLLTSLISTHENCFNIKKKYSEYVFLYAIIISAIVCQYGEYWQVVMRKWWLKTGNTYSSPKLYVCYTFINTQIWELGICSYTMMIMGNQRHQN